MCINACIMNDIIGRVYPMALCCVLGFTLRIQQKEVRQEIRHKTTYTVIIIIIIIIIILRELNRKRSDDRHTRRLWLVWPQRVLNSIPYGHLQYPLNSAVTGLATLWAVSLSQFCYILLTICAWAPLTNTIAGRQAGSKAIAYRWDGAAGRQAGRQAP